MMSEEPRLVLYPPFAVSGRDDEEFMSSLEYQSSVSVPFEYQSSVSVPLSLSLTSLRNNNNTNNNNGDSTMELKRRLEKLSKNRRARQQQKNAATETNTEFFQHHQQEKAYDNKDERIATLQDRPLGQRRQPTLLAMSKSINDTVPSALNPSAMSACRSLDETIDNTIDTRSLPGISSPSTWVSSSRNISSWRRKQRYGSTTPLNQNLRRLMCTSSSEKNVDTSFAQVKDNPGSSTNTSGSYLQQKKFVKGNNDEFNNSSITGEEYPAGIVFSGNVFDGTAPGSTTKLDRLVCTNNYKSHPFGRSKSLLEPPDRSSFAFQALPNDDDELSVDFLRLDDETRTTRDGDNDINNTMSPGRLKNWRRKFGTSLSSQFMTGVQPRPLEDVVPRGQQAYSEICSEPGASTDNKMVGGGDAFINTMTTASPSCLRKDLWYLRSKRDEEGGSLFDNEEDHMMHAVMFVTKNTSNEITF